MKEYSSYREKEMYEMSKKGHLDPCWHREKKHDKKCDKHDHKKKDDHKKTLVDFAYDTLHPNVEEDNRLELTPNVQVPVASVTLNKVKKGDIVWLNGVLGLDNDAIGERTVFIRIYNGGPSVFIPGQEIYRARVEIDGALDDDNVVEPLSHVDAIKHNDKHATYTVTLEARGNAVFLNGPVTFTAALITKS